MRWSRRPALVAGVVAAGVLGLGACGGHDGGAESSSSAAGAVSDTPSGAGSSGGTDAGAGSASPTGSSRAGGSGAVTSERGSTESPAKGSDCTTDDLRARLAATGQEMNSKYFDLTLTNTTDGTCALKGYAGLSLVDAEGGLIGKPATRSQDGAAKAENVVLKAGQAAHAVVRTPDKGVTDGKCWAKPARIKVYPPNNTAALTASPGTLLVCGDSFTVGPFTAQAP